MADLGLPSTKNVHYRPYGALLHPIGRIGSPSFPSLCTLVGVSLIEVHLGAMKYAVP